MKKIIAILVFISALLLPYFVCNGEVNELNEQARKKADSGGYIKLKQGFTHYEAAGPADGETVVLVHGFSFPYQIWENTYSFLAKSGYRVIRFDLYGRGYSDRPDIEYNAEIFEEQLLELISSLKVKTPITLIGVSMGGAITVFVTSRHPELIKKIVLIDPAGLPLDLPLIGKIMKFPILGEYLFSVFGDSNFEKGFYENFYNPSGMDFLKIYLIEQMKYRGYKRAILSTLRNFPMSELENSYEKLAKTDIPILLIWGKEDRVIPFELSKKVLSIIPRTKLLAVEKCGHTPQLEKPELVNPALQEYLK